MGYDFDIPSYQSSVVQAYLAKDPKTGSYTFNQNGRATPDVSAVAEKFEIVTTPNSQLVSGTSASTPTWGGIISLLNEECLAASGGSKTLGFINPLLYKNADAFKDITEGTNAIAPNFVGWKATAGWDAVTGL